MLQFRMFTVLTPKGLPTSEIPNPQPPGFWLRTSTFSKEPEADRYSIPVKSPLEQSKPEPAPSTTRLLILTGPKRGKSGASTKSCTPEFPTKPPLGTATTG